MLIQALCDYYDVMARAGKVLEEGYSLVRIHYRVGLSADGRVEGIELWQVPKTTTDAKGKTKETLEPRQLALFRRTEKPGIDANIVEHRPLYLFGLNLEKDGTLHPEDRTNKAAKSHQAFVERNLAFMEGVDSPIVNAFRQFILNWKPEEESANPCLLGLGKGYATGGFVFCLSGDPSMMLQDDPQLKARWQETLKADNGETDRVVRQCAITGEMDEIASIHDKINGVLGGLATGTKLVAFKNDSAFSYGAEQALNSNISVTAMRKYTQALNILTNSKTHKTMLGDVTMVRFAMSPDRRCDALVGNAMLGTTDDAEDEDALDAGETEKLLQKVYADARLGVANADRILQEQHIDPTVAYYIVGFKPNASRLAVQFLYRRQLGQLIQNVAQHQADMAISADAKLVPLWQITRQLVSPKATKQTVDPSLTAKLLEAIVYGYRYPAFLLATVVRRIQTDSDNETDKYIKFNPIRVGILKACLNRSARLNGQMEEISMALNKENTNPAYLCGRLFAVLERVQEQANPGINRTITDAYFASASTRPALIFPRLIRLAQTHLKKLEYAGYWNRLIGEINTKLNGEYPDTLDLADQGRFDIGYYQQKYAPSEKKTENTDMMEGK